MPAMSIRAQVAQMQFQASEEERAARWRLRRAQQVARNTRRLLFALLKGRIEEQCEAALLAADVADE